MKKTVKEWTVKAYWGKIAMISWGNAANPPLLLVHGLMDSAATFIPLLEQLPDTYYYVALDLPGHGKSDTFPPGHVVSQIQMIEAIRLIVQDMKWHNFTYLSHSMGFILGIFYNHVFPGEITKMVHIDPVPPMSYYYYAHYEPAFWYQYLYDMFYSNYERNNINNARRVTLKKAVNLIVQNRDMTEEQAELILSRCLVPAGEGTFVFSWDQRMKNIANIPMSEDILINIITKDAPPSLMVEASENIAAPPGKEFAINVLEKCLKIMPNFLSVTINGGHDVHITNPERIVPHIEKFLRSEKCKL